MREEKRGEGKEKVRVTSWEELGQKRLGSPGGRGVKRYLLEYIQVGKWVFSRVALVQGTEP